MIRVFEKSSPDFQRRLDALCNRSSELGTDIEAAARKVIAEVRAGGDAAVRALTAEFDKRAARRAGAARGASGTRWRRASTPEVRAALEHAARRVRAFHERERHASFEISEDGDARRQPRRSAGPHRHLRPGRQGPLPVDGDHDRRSRRASPACARS